MAKPIPYKGDKGYIFISYAHRDADLVLPIVEQMQRDGYRVWYDEGIDPGTEWDEFIASHVMGCGYFIAFLSRNYLRSENCKDELNFARDLKKPQVLVYLEKVQLPRGLELRVGRCESFHADAGGNFLKKLYKAEGIREFYEGTVKTPKRSPLLWAIPAVLAAVLGIGAALLPRSEPESTGPPPETTTGPEETTTGPEETTTGPQEIINLPTVETVIFEGIGVKVTAQDVQYTEDGDVNLLLNIENTRDESAEVHAFNFYINAFSVPPEISYFSTELQPKETAQVPVCWDRDTLRKAGIGGIASANDITAISGDFFIRNSELHGGSFIYYPYGEENNVQAEYVIHENDQVLMDNEKFSVILRDTFYNENNEWVLNYVTINKTDASAHASFLVNGINGYFMRNFSDKVIPPNSWQQNQTKVIDWQYTEQETILEAKITMYIWPDDSQEVYNETALLYPEGGSDYTFEKRQLQEDDLILLDTEYLQIAVVESGLEDNFYQFRIYCYNKASDNIRIGEVAFNEEPTESILLNERIGLNAQTVLSYGIYCSNGEMPRTVSFSVTVEDRFGRVLFDERIAFHTAMINSPQ